MWNPLRRWYPLTGENLRVKFVVVWVVRGATSCIATVEQIQSDTVALGWVKTRKVARTDNDAASY